MGRAQVRTPLRAVAFLAALCLFDAGSANAEQCSLAKGPLGGIDGMPEVRQELCPIAPGGTSGQLRVTRLRMSEVLAGMIAKNAVLPELSTLFGDTPVVENDVLLSLKELYAKFAHATTYQASSVSVSISVQPPRTGGDTSEESSEDFSNDVRLETVGEGNRTLWSITSPFGDGSISHPLYDKKLIRTIFDTTAWPKDYKQSYRKCARTRDEYGEPIEPNADEPGACILLWRNIPISDFKAIEASTVKIFEQYHSPSRKNAKDGFNWEDPKQRFSSHFSFLRYIGKQSWPDGFLQSQILLNNDGCGWEPLLSYFVIPLSLDVAIIENTSDQAVILEKILGSNNPEKGLRILTAANTAGIEPLVAQSVSLPANRRVILPLRIVFDGADPDEDENLAGQQEYFQRIQSRASGYVFKSKIYPPEAPENAKYEDEGYFLLKKVREAFLEPAPNDPTKFLYGPEATLTGFTVTSRKLSLEGQLPTTVLLSGSTDASDALPSMNLDQNPGAGESCPVLYFQDPGQNAWVRHGKVIHSARGPDREETERIPVPPDTRKFRLAEEEPESAYIRDIRLDLTLKDGRRLAFAPLEYQHRDLSKRLFEVPAYTHVDVSFDVPPDVEAVGIARSELRITGYYRRLASMLLSNLFDASRPGGLSRCIGTGTKTVCPISFR